MFNLKLNISNVHCVCLPNEVWIEFWRLVKTLNNSEKKILCNVSSKTLCTHDPYASPVWPNLFDLQWTRAMTRTPKPRTPGKVGLILADGLTPAWHAEEVLADLRSRYILDLSIWKQWYILYNNCCIAFILFIWICWLIFV